MVSSTDAARNALVEANMDAVDILARRMFFHHGRRVELETLVSDGYLGLIDAAKRFDASRGYKFSTFAQRRIQGAMYDGIRERDWLSRRARQKGEHDHIRFMSSNDKAMTRDDGTDVDFSASMGQDDEPCPLEQREEVAMILRGLPPLHRHCMMLRYAEDLLMSEIGQAMGLSESRISQVHKQALAMIRKKIGVTI